MKGKWAVRDRSTPKFKPANASPVPEEAFKELPSNFLREIEVRGKVGEFEKGHIFFNTGQNRHGLFLLKKKAVQTFRTSGAKKLIITELRAPAVFGEMGCVGRCFVSLFGGGDGTFPSAHGFESRPR